MPGGRPPKIRIEERIVVDEPIKEKPLSDLISDIKQLVKRYRNQITTKISEKDGKVSEIMIEVRIQL